MHLVFLALLVACGPSSSGAAYDACVDGYELRCRCGDYTSNTEDASADCEVANDERRLHEVCETYDLRKCDPNSAQWDADGCDAAEAATEAWESNEYREFGECVQDAYERECPGPDVTYDDWVALLLAAKEQCAE